MGDVHAYYRVGNFTHSMFVTLLVESEIEIVLRDKNQTSYLAGKS